LKLAELCCDCQTDADTGIPFWEDSADECCEDNYHIGTVATPVAKTCCIFELLGADNDCCEEFVDTENSPPHWTVTFNPITHVCEIIQTPLCPCDGCCDFNCCDELDYFMHKAWYEHYSTTDDYTDFMDFYDAWFAEFYSWWHSAPEGYEVPVEEEPEYPEPEVEEPTYPVVEEPTYPEVEAPTYPEVEAPTYPEVEAPTYPVVEEPAEPTYPEVAEPVDYPPEVSEPTYPVTEEPHAHY